MSKAYHDRLRERGEEDFKAGKPIDAFYNLPLKVYKEVYRGSYEIGWRAAELESRNRTKESTHQL